MFNKIANLCKAITNVFDDNIQCLYVILSISVIFFIIAADIFTVKSNKNQNIENVEFVVDTLINDSEAVIKLNQIEIIVNNPYKWKENDTLILIKK